MTRDEFFARYEPSPEQLEKINQVTSVTFHGRPLVFDQKSRDMISTKAGFDLQFDKLLSKKGLIYYADFTSGQFDIGCVICEVEPDGNVVAMVT